MTDEQHEEAAGRIIQEAASIVIERTKTPFWRVFHRMALSRQLNSLVRALDSLSVVRKAEEAERAVLARLREEEGM